MNLSVTLLREDGEKDWDLPVYERRLHSYNFSDDDSSDDSSLGDSSSSDDGDWGTGSNLDSAPDHVEQPCRTACPALGAWMVRRFPS